MPLTGLEKLIAATGAPLQTEMSDGTVITKVGFTVMVYVDGVPVQLLAVGVTVIVAVIGLTVLLVAVKAGIFPEPLPAMPMAVLLLAQV